MQVMQLQPLQRLMGRRPLMQALRSMPSILNHDPEGLALNYASLAPAFGADKLNDMLAKCVMRHVMQGLLAASVLLLC